MLPSGELAVAELLLEVVVILLGLEVVPLVVVVDTTDVDGGMEVVRIVDEVENKVVDVDNELNVLDDP